MKNTIHTAKYSLFMLTFLLFFLSLPGYGQQIKLIDAQSGQPVADVFFMYGDQQGLSQEDGFIEIAYQKDAQLQLTHLAYRPTVLRDEEVQQALKKGVFHLTPRTHILQPAIVMQLRPVAGDVQRQEIGYAHQSMPDAGAFLNQLPGISAVKRSAAYGFDPVLRGFQNERLLILIDGIQSAHEACPNRMDPPASQVALNSMSNVEIQKGPYSLRYGMAFGGVINFSSVKARFTPEHKVLGRLSTGYESNVNALRTEAMTGITGRSYDFRLFGAYAKGRDYTDGEGLTIPADFNRLNLGGRLALKAGKKQSIIFSANHNRSDDVDFAGAPMDLRKDHTWLLKAGHQFEVQRGNLQKWDNTVFATLVDHRMDNLLKPLDPRMMNAWVEAKTLTYGARTETQWNFRSTYLYFGADFKAEEAIGHRNREFLMGPMAGMLVEDAVWQHGRITKSGIFAEWHLPSLKRGRLKGKTLYILSVRLDYNHATALEASETFVNLYKDNTSTNINPGFSAGFNHQLSERTSFALWAGRTQRSPSISERYIHFLPIGSDPYEMLGNPGLKPEKNNQLDLLFSWNNAKIALRFNAFGAFMQDYISSQIRTDLSPLMPNSPGVRQYINIDRALMAGFELGFRQIKPVAGLRQALNLNYTYGQDPISEEALPEIPPLEVRYRLSGNYLRKRLQAEFQLRYAFAQRHIAASFGETPTPAFYVIDLSVSWESKALGSLRAGVNNLLARAYYEHLSRSVRNAGGRPIYNPGRSFFVMYSIRF